MIDILLATYNGEKYIGQQIDSIRCQTYGDWQLLIHDDGSSDNTISIVKELSLKDSRIRLIEDGVVHLGVAKNFIHLLQYSTSPFVMFCDQDDVWLPNKIELTLSKMKTEEDIKMRPILVHTDMQVVDSSLQVIASSFWKQMRLLPQYNSYYDLLACHNANGCTILLNGMAKQEILRNPSTAPMHDIWAALAVAAHKDGLVTYIEDCTMLYRQHENNVVGSHNTSVFTLMKKIVHLRTIMLHIWNSPRRYSMLRPTSRLCYLLHKIKIVLMRLLNY